MTDTNFTFLTSFDGVDLFAPLIRLLAHGDPVTIEDLAAASAQDTDDIGAVLRAQPGTEWDDTGRIVGFGLTPHPTEHRFIVAGRTLYTWCAADTLFFPVILDQPAAVESACPASGVPIHLEVTPDRVVALDPPSAVVTQILDSGCLDDIRAKVCDQGHFYASPELAAEWAAHHPGGDVQSIADAFASIRRTCQQLGWTPTDTLS